MTETGVVVKTENQKAIVRFKRKSACESCKLCTFSKGSDTVDITLQNDVMAQEGDTVEVQMANSSVLVSSLLVYILPLAFALLGLVVGNWLLGEIGALVFLVVFLVSSFIGVKVIDKKISTQHTVMQPAIKKLIKRKIGEI